MEVLAVVGHVIDRHGSLLAGIQRDPRFTLRIESPRSRLDDAPVMAVQKSLVACLVGLESGSGQYVPVTVIEKGGDVIRNQGREVLDSLAGTHVEGADGIFDRYGADLADHPACVASHGRGSFFDTAAQLPDLVAGKPGESHERKNFDKNEDEDEFGFNAHGPSHARKRLQWRISLHGSIGFGHTDVL
ncbi:MAG: hypothetical protein CSYNP_04473 [Syntrophus sp. SKADARSKE-3]|nr:hypothetical protein [Syntrophus sp. SKADARSKE-3]